jgi:dTDP-4-dehydrorhamnose 3,5-epimerase
MRITPTAIPDVLIIEPNVFSDARGFFFENFNAKIFKHTTGIDVSFVQDNFSRSGKNVLRGLHFQVTKPQGKLVSVLRGAAYDVAVDIRKNSPTFGTWVGATLTEDNHHQLWIPAGFAHGFVALTDRTDVLYKTTDYYTPECERCMIWNDPALAIDWPIDVPPLLSEKDKIGVLLSQVDG